MTGACCQVWCVIPLHRCTCVTCVRRPACAGSAGTASSTLHDQDICLAGQGMTYYPLAEARVSVLHDCFAVHVLGFGVFCHVVQVLVQVVQVLFMRFAFGIASTWSCLGMTIVTVCRSFCCSVSRREAHQCEALVGCHACSARLALLLLLWAAAAAAALCHAGSHLSMGVMGVGCASVRLVE